jgi:hypothetical protein
LPCDGAGLAVQVIDDCAAPRGDGRSAGASWIEAKARTSKMRISAITASTPTTSATGRTTDTSGSSPTASAAVNENMKTPMASP